VQSAHYETLLLPEQIGTCPVEEAKSRVSGHRDSYLSGEHVVLRERHPEDVPILQTQLYNDLGIRAQADTRPWRPLPPDPSLSPYAPTAAGEDAAFFSIVAANDGDLVGEALLWGIDLHNRLGHLGLALLPAFRGRGWSAEVLHLLCRYGFAVRGLNRLQLETTTSNQPMIRAALRAGFSEEGVLRQAHWVLGAFLDSAVFGLLAADWHDIPSEAME
jgi:RimJ/RimL family protein N-acetyltransferase